MEKTLWGNLPLLARASSKETVEDILQALWRSRKTGLSSSDRLLFRDLLQLETDADLDPLLLCLRILIRRCVYENISKDEIHKLFPDETLPEMKRLLIILLQKFQKDWQDDVLKDQAAVPCLKSMTWSMASQDREQTEPLAVINMKLQNDAKPCSCESEVKFQISKDGLETMKCTMQSMKEQVFTITDDPPDISLSPRTDAD